MCEEPIASFCANAPGEKIELPFVSTLRFSLTLFSHSSGEEPLETNGVVALRRDFTPALHLVC